MITEVVYVLASFYEVPRPRVAELARAIIGFPTIGVLDSGTLLRALEAYEVNRWISPMRSATVRKFMVGYELLAQPQRGHHTGTPSGAVAHAAEGG